MNETPQKSLEVFIQLRYVVTGDVWNRTGAMSIMFELIPTYTVHGVLMWWIDILGSTSFETNYFVHRQIYLLGNDEDT